MKGKHRQSAGFTLIELAIVIMVVGILVAITVPNYIKFANRAKDASVKQNMHVIQSGIEVFAVDNVGDYPLPADEVTIQGLMPNGVFPVNPFTKAATLIVWNAAPGAPGDIGITNLPGGGYMIEGYGKDAVLAPPIVVGD
jgi:prepilin-type N-terminal cleavage/methylation domain-containing protein